MVCPHCKTEIPENSRFCPECGNALECQAPLREVDPAYTDEPSEAQTVSAQSPCESVTDKEVPIGMQAECRDPFDPTLNHAETKASSSALPPEDFSRPSTVFPNPPHMIPPQQTPPEEVVFPGRPCPPPPPAPTCIPYGAKAPKRPSSRAGFAVSSLVISLLDLAMYLPLGFPLSIVGIIFGVLGVKSDKKGASIAGIVLSSLALILQFLIFCFLIIAIISSASEGYTEDYFFQAPYYFT